MTDLAEVTTLPTNGDGLRAAQNEAQRLADEHPEKSAEDIAQEIGHAYPNVFDGDGPSARWVRKWWGRDSQRTPQRKGPARKTPRQAPTATDEPARKPARVTTQRPVVPQVLIGVTGAAVAIVAAVTTVTSYTHTYDLAQAAGQAWLSWILPAAVDGLVIAGSTALLVDRHRGERGYPLAWFAVVVGLASSMAANIAAVDPTLVDLRVVKWVMAGYAPLALAVSGHLLLRMLGDPSAIRTEEKGQS